MAILGKSLFYAGFGKRASLSDALNNNLAGNVPAEVEKITAAQFKAKSDEELVTMMVKRCGANPLVLSLDDAVGDAQPTRVQVRDVFEGPIQVDGLRVTKAIPFAGDVVFFELEPGGYGMSHPQGEVRGGSLIIGMDVRQSDTDAAVRHIEETLAEIQKKIEEQALPIAEHNSALPGAALAAIQRRRRALEQASDVASRLSGR